jgi:hypothetical protein
MPGFNPYTAQGSWGNMALSVAGNRIYVPGIIQSVDGASNPEEWLINKPLNASNARTVWRGTNLAESIKVVTNLYNATEFEYWEILRDMVRPKRGSRPESFYVISPQLNFAGISRCSLRYINPPTPAPGLSWTGEFAMIEFRPPKIAPVGPAEAPPPDSAQTIENKQIQKEVDSLVSTIKGRGRL